MKRLHIGRGMIRVVVGREYSHPKGPQPVNEQPADVAKPNDAYGLAAHRRRDPERARRILAQTDHLLKMPRCGEHEEHRELGDRGCIARHLGRRKRCPDPQVARRIDVDPFVSCSHRLNERQLRLAGHLRGCDFAQNQQHLDVRARTALSSHPMDQLVLWELGSQFLKDPGGKAAGANKERDLHWSHLVSDLWLHGVH
jgi:hypothetical protein